MSYWAPNGSRLATFHFCTKACVSLTWIPIPWEKVNESHEAKIAKIAKIAKFNSWSLSTLKSLHIQCKERPPLLLESRRVSPSHTSLSQNQSRCQASGDQSLEHTCSTVHCAAVQQCSSAAVQCSHCGRCSATDVWTWLAWLAWRALLVPCCPNLFTSSEAPGRRPFHTGRSRILPVKLNSMNSRFDPNSMIKFYSLTHFRRGSATVLTHGLVSQPYWLWVGNMIT